MRSRRKALTYVGRERNRYETVNYILCVCVKGCEKLLACNADIQRDRMRRNDDDECSLMSTRSK
jgi:hypothetical protein